MGESDRAKFRAMLSLVHWEGAMTESIWGPLAERYATSKPRRRLLALDGGGIRGVVTLEILAEIERQLATATKRGAAFRLCDFFDYIGGTSTGAIIAAGLARGMSCKDLLDFYVKIGPEMFQKERLLYRMRHLYRSDPLAEKLRETFQVEIQESNGDKSKDDARLFPEHLRCLLLVVTRNVTTDSPWPISSNPAAKYNARELAYCNLQIPVWRLVRASTAAPIYFPPEIIEWEPGNPDKTFVFVDGGVTPYNNPSFLLYRMATAREYRLQWPVGEDKLMLVSVGTGEAATLGATELEPETNVVSTLAGLPGALMNAASVDQDTNCRVVGRCVHGAKIDREIGDMVPRRDDTLIPLEESLGRDFLYARYNADLSAEGLKALGLSNIDPAAVKTLDAVDRIAELLQIGRAAARAVDLQKHFGPFLKAGMKSETDA